MFEIGGVETRRCGFARGAGAVWRDEMSRKTVLTVIVSPDVALVNVLACSCHHPRTSACTASDATRPAAIAPRSIRFCDALRKRRE